MLVFFHWFSSNFWLIFLLILSNINLLILSSSFLAGLISRTVGWLSKFYLWSFIVIKLLPSSFVSILFITSLSLIKFFPTLLICFLMLLFAFLQVEVIEFIINLSYSSFVNRCIFEVLSANVIVLCESLINLMSSLSFSWKVFLIFLNLMFLINFTKTFSKRVSFFTCLGL